MLVGARSEYREHDLRDKEWLLFRVQQAGIWLSRQATALQLVAIGPVKPSKLPASAAAAWDTHVLAAAPHAACRCCGRRPAWACSKRLARRRLRWLREWSRGWTTWQRLHRWAQHTGRGGRAHSFSACPLHHCARPYSGMYTDQVPLVLHRVMRPPPILTLCGSSWVEGQVAVVQGVSPLSPPHTCTLSRSPCTLQRGGLSRVTAALDTAREEVQKQQRDVSRRVVPVVQQEMVSRQALNIEHIVGTRIMGPAGMGRASTGVRRLAGLDQGLCYSAGC